jgi:hypothetical protein
MKLKLVTFLSLIITSASYSQGLINLNKQEARKHFEDYIQKEKVKAKIEETDSSMLFLIRDTSVRNVDPVLHFNESGKCDKETTISSCDSCAQKYLNAALSYKQFRWTKINNTTYLSKFSKKLILEINPAIPFSHIITRISLNRREYKNLLYGKKGIDNI